MKYRQTSTQVTAEIIDSTAKSDSTISTSAQSFSTPNKLKNNNTRTVDYMTNELNYSILDGSLQEIPNTNNLVYVSSGMSDGTLSFSSDPTITITFASAHSSAGITLNFDGHYLPDSVNIKYFANVNDVSDIADDTFTVTSYDFFCNHQSIIENYKKIVITFTSTKYPYSFIKINNIEYGAIFNWGSNDLDNTSSLINARILEETDIMSNNLAMDTLEFTVYDDENVFNIINPDGLYAIIQTYQKVKVNEIVEIYEDGVLTNTQNIFMGNFYIKEWTSSAEHELTFKCVDLIGILEDTEFNKGRYYVPENDTVKSIIDDIMACAGISSTMYEISNSLKNLKMNGFLPLMSCRQALQQVIFCIGAVADCARSETINIYVPSKLIAYNVSDENNLEYEQIQKNDMISDVSIMQCILSKGSENVSVFSGYLEAGSYTISTTELIYAQAGGVSPYIDLNETSGTGTIDQNDIGLSHFKINVTQAGYFSVKSTTWSISKFLDVSVHNPLAKMKKEIKCENNYFLNSGTIGQPLTYSYSTANRLLNYYANPNVIDTEFIVNNEKTGNWCLIKNKYGNQTKGNILRMDIDLTGGFTAKAKLLCVEDISNLEYNYVCTDFTNSATEHSELYSGDNIGLI